MLMNDIGLKFSSGILCLGIMVTLVSENELGIIPSFPTHLLFMALESTLFRNLVPIKQSW